MTLLPARQGALAALVDHLERCGAEPSQISAFYAEVALSLEDLEAPPTVAGRQEVR